LSPLTAAACRKGCLACPSSSMNQQLLIPSGCQQWIRQPTAIGPANQFAVSSALAIYIHGSDDFRLQRILAQHNQHLNAVCWSPVDSKLLACATSEQASAAVMTHLLQGLCCDCLSIICSLCTTHDKAANTIYLHQLTAPMHAHACLLACLLACRSCR
jgi:hypothetical protein